MRLRMRHAPWLALALGLLLVGAWVLRGGSREPDATGSAGVDRVERTAGPGARLVGARDAAPGPPAPPPSPGLAAEAVAGDIRGTVRYDTGGPAAGVTVQLWQLMPVNEARGSMDGELPTGGSTLVAGGSAVTDEEGRFVLRATAAMAMVATEAGPGFEVATASIASLPANVELVLRRRVERRTTVTVRVVDAEGQPVPGARVALYPPETGPGTKHAGRDAVKRTETDAEGRVELADLDPDRSYRIHIPDLPKQDLWGTSVEGWTPRDEEIRLRRALAITGRIVDEAGDAVPHAVVARGTDGYVCQTTNDRGTFRLTLLPPGPVTLRAGPPRSIGPWSPSVVVDAGARDVVLSVPRGEALRVVVENWPTGHRGWAYLTNVRGVTQGHSYLWCDDGVFDFAGLRPGEAYHLWIPAVGEDHACHLDPEVRSSRAPHAVTLVPGGSIRGVIHGPPEGRPYDVWARGPGFHVPGKVEAIDDTFVIVGLPPGRWNVEACTRGLEASHSAAIETDVGSNVDLTLTPDGGDD